MTAPGTGSRPPRRSFPTRSRRRSRWPTPWPRAARACPTSWATCSSRPCSSPSSSRSGARPTWPSWRAARRTSSWRGTPTSTGTPPRHGVARGGHVGAAQARGAGRPGDLPRAARRASRPGLRHQGPAPRGGGGLRLPRRGRGPGEAGGGDRRAARGSGGARAGGRAVRRGRGGAGARRRSRARPARLRAALPRARGGRGARWRPGRGPSSRACRWTSSCAGTRHPARQGRRRDRPHSEWAALERHASAVRDAHLRDLFASDPARGEELSLDVADLYIDYSKNRVTRETLVLLVALARSARACRGASRRCSPASGSTSPRGGRCCTWRCGAARRADRGGRAQRGAGRPRRARPDGRPRRPGALGGVDRRHRASASGTW